MHLDLVTILIGLALGAVIGAAGGLFGIGGGLLVIPVLGIFFGLDQQHAQGTAMVMVAPNVLVGLVAYARRVKLDLRLAVTLSLAAIPLTYLGAQIATHVASAPLRRGFAIFLAGLAVYVIVRILRSSRNATLGVVEPAAWQWAGLIGASGGMISGIFSVGGAIFAVPIMSLVFGLTQAAAQGLGLALVAPGTLVGLLAYVRAGDVDWQLGLPLALGGVLFVNAGVTLAQRLPDRLLRVLFALLIAVSSAALFWKS